MNIDFDRLDEILVIEYSDASTEVKECILRIREQVEYLCDRSDEMRIREDIDKMFK